MKNDPDLRLWRGRVEAGMGPLAHDFDGHPVQVWNSTQKLHGFEACEHEKIKGVRGYAGTKQTKN
jgi:hypothetical protein